MFALIISYIEEGEREKLRVEQEFKRQKNVCRVRGVQQQGGQSALGATGEKRVEEFGRDK
jgi:hypothetical protein